MPPLFVFCGGVLFSLLYSAHPVIAPPIRLPAIMPMGPNGDVIAAPPASPERVAVTIEGTFALGFAIIQCLFLRRFIAN